MSDRTTNFDKISHFLPGHTSYIIHLRRVFTLCRCPSHLPRLSLCSVLHSALLPVRTRRRNATKIARAALGRRLLSAAKRRRRDRPRSLALTHRPQLSSKFRLCPATFEKKIEKVWAEPSPHHPLFYRPDVAPLLQETDLQTCCCTRVAYAFALVSSVEQSFRQQVEKVVQEEVSWVVPYYIRIRTFSNTFHEHQVIRGLLNSQQNCSLYHRIWRLLVTFLSDGCNLYYRFQFPLVLNSQAFLASPSPFPVLQTLANTRPAIVRAHGRWVCPGANPQLTDTVWSGDVEEAQAAATSHIPIPPDFGRFR